MTRILVASMAFDAEQGGGGVRVAYDLATGLAQRGHQIVAVCEDLYNRGLDPETVEGVTVLRYRLPTPKGIPFRRHREHVDATRNVMRKHLTEPPQVVHGHHPFQYLAALELFGSQARSCYTIHSPSVQELRITWGNQGLVGRLKILLGLATMRRLESRILLDSSVLAALSSHTCGLISADYGDAIARRIQVIPGWVDLKRFAPLSHEAVNATRRQLGWPMDIPVLFVLRRLEPRMGLNNLLRALVLVKQRGLRVHTAIGGTGSLSSNLMRLSNSVGLEQDVTFMGFVPGALLPLAYAAADVSVIPSMELECFGLIALEALACGKPTLVTPVGALPEVMRNFELQWIAQDNTPEAIADLLCAHLEGRLPVHTAEELRAVITQRYTLERALAEYEQVLIGE